MLAENVQARAVSSFVDEAIDEAIGTSSKKWALLLIALFLGAAGALWLTRRRATGASVPAPDPGGPS